MRAAQSPPVRVCDMVCWGAADASPLEAAALGRVEEACAKIVRIWQIFL